MAESCQTYFSDYAQSGYTNTRERLGVKIESGSDWIGKEVTAVKWWLMHSGSNSGTVYCRIYRDGTTDPIHTFGSVDIQTLNEGSAGFCDGGCNWSEHTFTGDAYTLATNDILCVVNDNGIGDPVMYVNPYYDGEPNNLVQMRYNGSNWSEASGESYRLCITFSAPASESVPFVPPPIAWVNV